MNLFVRCVGLTGRLLPKCFLNTLYERPKAAQMIIKFLNRIVDESIQEVVIVTGPIAGLKLFINLRKQKYFWMGTYEPWVQEAIVQYLRPGMHAWDIGAFIGYHTLLMRKIAGPHRIIAIEPDPLSRDWLEQNLQLNGYEDVTIHPVAVEGHAGRVRLEHVPDGPSQTSVVNCEEGECEAVSLDLLLESLVPPDLIKMDIEGAESAAFSGAANVLKKIRPVWIVELHGKRSAQAIEHLLAANYKITHIDRWIPSAAELIGGGSEHILAIPF